MSYSEKLRVKTYNSPAETNMLDALLQAFEGSPIPSEELFSNLGLFIPPKDFSRLLFLAHIYNLIVPYQGIVLDLGTKWGQNAVVFNTLRGIFEPFNRHRRIVAFDTFAGFPSVSVKDGISDLMKPGNVSTTEGYANILFNILNIHQQLNPLEHIRKYDVVKGDATKTLPFYLKQRPETIVALAYFDFDIYEPTKKCLTALLPHLTKGAVLVFDELNDHDSPGETIALREVLGNVEIRRWPYVSRTSYIIYDGRPSC
jgi:hypothetical protein